MSHKYVYSFGGGKGEGNATMKAVLGGKGANLAEMTTLGLPVPPGFTITAEVCDYYYRHGKKYPEVLAAEIDQHLARLEELMGRRFGDPKAALLVSVRSGAAVSMPGMMDTVLNLGLNAETVPGLIEEFDNPRFVWDAYRRFVNMFGDVVRGVEHELFEHELQALKDARGVELDTDLSSDDLKELVDIYKRVYREHTGEAFPEDPREQLQAGIDAVFSSWNIPRAVKYRELNGITGLLGTAVNVQTMVFGNMGLDSGTGVCFTRDPATGDNHFYGEYLMNAQGEDVVAGIRTPLPLDQLRDEVPELYDELDGYRLQLERHYRDMQDMEFTIQQGKMYVLQTRGGKRTGPSAIQIAVDMVEEGLITTEEAILRVTADDIDQMLHPAFIPSEEAKAKTIAGGLPASPGAATGRVFFTAAAAEAEAERIAKEIERAKGDKARIKALKEDGKLMLVRIETSPEDIGGMSVAQGILTSRGGMTSHAAVVARGMGTPCVCGAGDVAIDYATKQFVASGVTVGEGDWVSVNGSLGRVYPGKISTQDPELTGAFGTFMDWCDEYRRLKVRTNADTGHDTRVAIGFGAQGIGLCRTEHMFFEGARIVSFRRMILVAETVKDLRAEIAGIEVKDKPSKEEVERLAAAKAELAKPEAQYQQALSELLPMQRKDFEAIFTALEGRPATIRLLDPPLHEFLPHDAEGQQEMAATMDIDADGIRELVSGLHEFNPMLGHRGCRLGLTYPEVTDMQVRAIIEAAINVKRDSGMTVTPEIMVPLGGKKEELAMTRERAEAVIAATFAENDMKPEDLPVLIGTMIEVPRAAVTADEIAEVADFFSFGTNDLTQMGCGFSRDDAGKFLGDYVEMGVYANDPFQVLDPRGIGRLVEMACKLGRETNADLHLGICGEHGGEPASVKFLHGVGLDYVSCSPYRVPIARHAAAQAVLEEKA